MHSSILALAIALGSSNVALARQEFVNHGTTQGWDNQYIDAGTAGKISDSTTASLLPSKESIKFETTHISSGYTGRYHAEKHYAKGYKRDEEKYYGFAFFLQPDWDFQPQSYNIAQFGADFGDVKDPKTGKRCDDFSPTTMIWLDGTKLITRVKRGALLNGQECTQTTDNINLFDGIKAGAWNRLVLRVKWKSDATGEFQAWLNGTEVANKKGIQTTLLDDHRDYQFRVGIYANGWHDQKKMLGNQPHRQLWIDEIGIGSTYADADPAENVKRV